MKRPVLLPVQGNRPFSPHTLDESLRMRLHGLTNAIFISFARLGDSISIWVADDRGMQFQTASLGFGEMQTLSDELLQLLRKPDGNPVWIDSISRQLYDSLFDPAEGVLDRERRLFVHFSDELKFIPLGALRNPQGEYLLDRMSFLTTADFPWDLDSSAPQLIGSDFRLLVVDAPDVSHREAGRYVPSHDPDEELFFIASLLPYNDMLSGFAATPHQFLRLAPNAEVVHCRIAVTADADGPMLHFAGEAKRPNARSSAPETDGRLHVAAIPRGALGRCKLVFLDADYLARRQGDSPDLWRQTSRSLHYGGVRSVILPLWNTAQPVRAEYTKVFYSTLNLGVSVEEAMRRASVHVRSCPGWAQPHYWANFIQSTNHG